MRRLFGLILAGGVLLGHAAVAQAQFGLTVGNPYTGTSLSIGTPAFGYGGYGFSGYGYPGYAYPGYGTSSYYSAVPSLAAATTYSSGYAGYAAPGTTYFSTGYAAPGAYYAPALPAYGYRSGYGYGYRPYYGGRGFRYGGWGGYRGLGLRRW